ncbi:F0F1 ATP synthase subunit delta [Roseomonas populi]|uniref:ATP synthase subunit delta n=1 Tax=Roseomonas populi TaxID=3121582 RepID=A0ABT1X0N8_9PROT|nr:F0F1 ATP synthase subunit delta [Roseomonas pecuniae]MCR0980943.1 F0F1 ATP synthase subunit delta [Roseomonas pecuniae]
MASEAVSNDKTAAAQGINVQGSRVTGGAAGRYALALLELSKDDRSVDFTAAEVEKLFALVQGDESFRAFLADPRLDSKAQRAGAFAVLDRAGVGGAVKNLVGVLIANRRLAELPGVLLAFGNLLADQRGQQTAEVTTAHPLSNTQRTQIAARLTEAGYSNVRLSETVDPSILGGLIVKIGSRLYDTSIKSRLQRLSYAMKGAA